MSGSIGGVDKEVIHVNNEPSFCDHITKGVIHELLEGGRGVGKTEEHYSWFEESLMSDESGFPLVSVFDLDIVISPPNVKFGEYLRPLEFINEIGNKWEEIGVADCMLVDVLVVLTGVKATILFLDKEERRRLWGIGGADLASFQVFIKEDLCCLSFFRREGVYLADLRFKGFVKVYFMVIGARGRNMVCGFLQEY